MKREEKIRREIEKQKIKRRNLRPAALGVILICCVIFLLILVLAKNRSAHTAASASAEAADAVQTDMQDTDALRRLDGGLSLTAPFEMAKSASYEAAFRSSAKAQKVKLNSLAVYLSDQNYKNLILMYAYSDADKRLALQQRLEGALASANLQNLPADVTDLSIDGRECKKARLADKERGILFNMLVCQDKNEVWQISIAANDSPAAEAEVQKILDSAHIENKTDK